MTFNFAYASLPTPDLAVITGSNLPGSLRPQFTWSAIPSDFSTFVKTCIHFFSTTRESKGPSSHRPPFYRTKQSDLLQFEYIRIVPSVSGENNVLMLCDDHSGYKWFFDFVSTSPVTASTAITDWCASFGAQDVLCQTYSRASRTRPYLSWRRVSMYPMTLRYRTLLGVMGLSCDSRRNYFEISMLSSPGFSSILESWLIL